MDGVGISGSRYSWLLAGIKFWFLQNVLQEVRAKPTAKGERVMQTTSGLFHYRQAR